MLFERSRKFKCCPTSSQGLATSAQTQIHSHWYVLIYDSSEGALGPLCYRPKIDSTNLPTKAKHTIIILKQRSLNLWLNRISIFDFHSWRQHNILWIDMVKLAASFDSPAVYNTVAVHVCVSMWSAQQPWYNGGNICPHLVIHDLCLAATDCATGVILLFFKCVLVNVSYRKAHIVCSVSNRHDSPTIESWDFRVEIGE